eukprot:CAMPEP_0197877518 /NCGR_PEP_ID=MMETSP1439-20131203/6194_1 /TAXON_ID=66791 /ORGANISM="Gonyaulax spinifera, Strain CCMP409" /LENGTH=34 /DNA_ID= /DNA_START= /DNA_END= /DNA_ORIENTATION=
MGPNGHWLLVDHARWGRQAEKWEGRSAARAPPWG